MKFARKRMRHPMHVATLTCELRRIARILSRGALFPVYSGESCLSVRLSVRLSNACIVTERKKDLSRSLYRYELPKIISLVFGEEEWLVGADPFCLKFCVRQPSPVGAKSPILNRY